VSEIEVFHIDRPEAANALDVTTAEALAMRAKLAVKNGSPGLIISSRSTRIFSSGGDLRSYGKMKTKKEGIRANARIRKILQDLAKTPLLIAAAVEGDCIGGGCELALACDLIIAGEWARFAFRQPSLGLSFGWGGASPLLKRVSRASVFEWMLSGRWVVSFEALRTGLADRVVPGGQAEAAARRIINDSVPGMTKLNPELVKKLKELLWKGGLNEAKLFEELWFSKGHLQALEKVLKSLGGN
jgi:enoyl-CoA hydratase/carnithine racemase